MTEPKPTLTRARYRDIGGLIFWTALCLGASAVGGAVTRPAIGTWYRQLTKPSFTPPDWVFAPVWTGLFLMMGLAVWMVWRRAGFANGRAAISVFCLQLALNLLWSLLFFGMRSPLWALIEIPILWAAIIVTIGAFRRVDRFAALLLLPYLLWVSFAVVLNASIWQQN